MFGARRGKGINAQKRKIIEIKKRSPMEHLRLHLKTKVLDFLERDDVSRMMPGKQDVMASTNGSKQQTRILCDYLQNVHDKFLSENPDIKMSFSYLCKLRPRHITDFTIIQKHMLMHQASEYGS